MAPQPSPTTYPAAVALKGAEWPTRESLGKVFQSMRKPQSTNMSVPNPQNEREILFKMILSPAVLCEVWVCSSRPIRSRQVDRTAAVEHQWAKQVVDTSQRLDQEQEERS